ncbi:hypothetical protein Mycsm_01003 [Mycobacterium sp. JS623]|nr:hypothetical protein [Mycobacterium sp. JS623]AGB21429.1 hypothetical protein Mycsm_01003 [Mycobacterium sp. JS623]
MPLVEPSPAELAAAQPMIEWLNTAPPLRSPRRSWRHSVLVGRALEEIR